MDSGQSISQPRQIETKQSVTAGWAENTRSKKRLLTPDQLPAAVFFQKVARSVRLFAPVAEYYISTPHKTFAQLERGGRYPSTAAMSGWSHGKTFPLVLGQDWTPEVIRIAEVIGHALAPDKKDNGVPGRFHACHAEKQLIAYFISRNEFLETEIRSYKKAFEYLNSYYCTQNGPEGATRRGK
ncbi:MAG: hypothetical protein L6R42_002488 [Xanthoria sp. 1 TBL-2021]|nr:MAG: hypothetical protein L6R42_002488 [Xanthoria sp. 1 TBL-2021]